MKVGGLEFVLLVIKNCYKVIINNIICIDVDRKIEYIEKYMDIWFIIVFYLRLVERLDFLIIFLV